MSKLISGKEAFDAAYNGDEAQWRWTGKDLEWRELKGTTSFSIDELKGGVCEFRLKPRTITINGIEVPACGVNYKPHTYMFVLNSLDQNEYSKVILGESDEIPDYWWKLEEEIKQVVAALRSTFNPQ